MQKEMRVSVYMYTHIAAKKEKEYPRDIIISKRYLKCDTIHFNSM